MKRKALRISLEVGIVILLVIGFFIINEQIKDNNIVSFILGADNYTYAYQVEALEETEDSYVLKGWFFELGSPRNEMKVDYKKEKPSLLLYNLNEDSGTYVNGEEKPKKGIPLTVEWNYRHDVNEYFSCIFDYSYCGFEAKILKKYINIYEEEYQLVFKPDEKGLKGEPANAYLANGKLQYFNPDDIMSLDVIGTDLKPVIDNGVCVASCLAYHVCVYQYQGKLYWIADSGYDFEEDGSTFIEYQLDTTQLDRLPKTRTDNGWFWDNIGADFEKYEVTSLINCGRYRVSVRDIPKEYAVTRIETGYYIDGQWIWKGVIRPLITQ